MALTAIHNNVTFGIGDVIKVSLKIKDGEKMRTQVFEGTVIAIKGRDTGKSFTVRRIGEQKIGIEQIFPLMTPSIEKIEVVKNYTKGTRKAKLYFIREKSAREIDSIRSRSISRA